MLSPQDRATLFEALRPPPGHLLDQAIGTSFTLDLEALLTAPIAFALFAAADDERGEAGAEPIGLLEAIRRYSDRITLFCQAGQIAVPDRHRSVFAWLEQSVVEVRAPRPHRLFHPKIWLARYRSELDGRWLLRFVCATRNMTFDASWDTVLVLESDAYESARGGLLKEHAGLASFLRALPEMTTGTIAQDRRAAIEGLVADLERVPFGVPDGFDEYRVHVLGMSRKRSVLPTAADQAVIVSPFLSEPFLTSALGPIRESLALVSREESFDRLDADALDGIGSLHVLNSAVVLEETAGDGNDAPAAGRESHDPGEAFGGLHAKLFVFDVADRSVVFTGSANATQAAFDGNVEVLVELTSAAGGFASELIATSRDGRGEASFADLLLDYEPVPSPIVDPNEELALDVDAFRREIAGAHFVATVRPGTEFEIELTCDAAVPAIEADAVELTVWPITLLEDQSARSLSPGQPIRAEFVVSLEGMTSFFALRARFQRGGAEVSSAFVVNAELVGAPTDRQSRLLAAMLRDPDRLLRYLLLLLADESTLSLEGVVGSGASWLRAFGGRGSWDTLPLLELLVRAVDRFPQRLDHINDLLRDLAEYRGALPKGFDDVWVPVWEARQGTKR